MRPRGTATEPVEHVTGDGYVLDLVLRRDGAVAWINEGGRGQYEVHAADRSGERMLASGTSIDPKSLKLGAGKLYWAQGAKPFSASLD
jgi:hypothetical protein